MSIVAMTREMGSLGSVIAQEVARRLGYRFLRNDILRDAAREYRVRESRLVGAVEEAPGLIERLRRPRLRYRAYLEASVLDAALSDRVVLVGRWSTLFLRGITHAVRVRVCAPPEVRARRVMERQRLDAAEAARRIAAYDEGVRARMRQMFDVDWTNPLLYDLVINTESTVVMTAVGESSDWSPRRSSSPRRPRGNCSVTGPWPRGSGRFSRRRRRPRPWISMSRRPGGRCSWRDWSGRRPNVRVRSPWLARRRA